MNFFGDFGDEGGLKSFFNISRKLFSMVDFGETELEKSKIRPQVMELELKNRFKPKPQQAKNFLSVKPTAVGKGKFFFFNFFQFSRRIMSF